MASSRKSRRINEDGAEVCVFRLIGHAHTTEIHWRFCGAPTSSHTDGLCVSHCAPSPHASSRSRQFQGRHHRTTSCHALFRAFCLSAAGTSSLDAEISFGFSPLCREALAALTAGLNVSSCQPLNSPTSACICFVSILAIGDRCTVSSPEAAVATGLEAPQPIGAGSGALGPPAELEYPCRIAACAGTRQWCAQTPSIPGPIILVLVRISFFVGGSLSSAPRLERSSTGTASGSLVGEPDTVRCTGSVGRGSLWLAQSKGTGLDAPQPILHKARHLRAGCAG
jgi:hypothetical protein